MVQSIAEDEELLDGSGGRQKRLTERQGRLEHRVERKRALILETLQRVGIDKIEHPEFTLYRSKGVPKVIIIDEDLIPIQYRIPQPLDLIKNL